MGRPDSGPPGSLGHGRRRNPGTRRLGQRGDKEDERHSAHVLFDRLVRIDGQAAAGKGGQDPHGRQQRPGVHETSPKVDGLQALAATVAHGSGLRRVGYQWRRLDQ